MNVKIFLARAIECMPTQTRLYSHPSSSSPSSAFPAKLAFQSGE